MELKAYDRFLCTFCSAVKVSAPCLVLTQKHSPDNALIVIVSSDEKTSQNTIHYDKRESPFCHELSAQYPYRIESSAY